MTEPQKRTEMKHETFMLRAIEVSRQSIRSGRGGPFGAVIVKDGAIVAEGRNEVTSALDPTAHAEVQAIRAACRALASFSLAGCEIYTSCEPCPMCLAAIYWARLDRIHYANARQDAARIGFDDEFLYQEVGRPLAQRSIPTRRLLPGEAGAVFAEWDAMADKTPY